MKIIEEESLLQGLKEGKMSAFNAIYSTYSKDLYIYLMHKLGTSDLCNDILQDVFVSLWEKREFLKITVSIKSYLFQSVRYKIVDQYRRNRQYEKYLVELDYYLSNSSLCPTDNIDHKNRLATVMNTINGFPVRMKEIFILSRFENQSVNSIAERLSISPQTVKNQLTKALHILREKDMEIYLVNVPLMMLMLDKISS